MKEKRSNGVGEYIKKIACMPLGKKRKQPFKHKTEEGNGCQRIMPRQHEPPCLKIGPLSSENQREHKWHAQQVVEVAEQRFYVDACKFQ